MKGLIMSIAEQLIDAQNVIFGKQKPGARAVHAKGIVLRGTFKSSGQASSLTKAPHLQGADVPITVRYSNFPGLFTVADADGLSSPRGMATRFHLPDGAETDVIGHSFNGFPAPNVEKFRELLIAIGASGPSAAKPTPLEVYLRDHPIAKAFLESQIPPPLSYATVSYFGVNAFKFTNAQGSTTFGRYQLRPEAGDKSLPKEELGKAAPDYLSQEIRERIARGTVRFKLLLEVAQAGDDVENPSVAWPQSRNKVELGSIEITSVVADSAAAEGQLLFNPANLPSGIEVADPMIAVRSAAYKVSYDRRSKSQ
jgi:catalase